MVVSQKDKNGVEFNEYIDYVDFRPIVVADDKKPCLSGSMFTIARKREVAEFTDGILDRNLIRCFHMKMVPVLEEGDKLWIAFKPRALNMMETVSGMRRLMNFLWGRDHKIIWKEGNFGYEINAIGKIIKKWDLDPF